LDNLFKIANFRILIKSKLNSSPNSFSLEKRKKGLRLYPGAQPQGYHGLINLMLRRGSDSWGKEFLNRINRINKTKNPVNPVNPV